MDKNADTKDRYFEFSILHSQLSIVLIFLGGRFMEDCLFGGHV